MTELPPRYKFVVGRGDASHAASINEEANQGYKATLMTYDPVGYSNNRQVVVLMEYTNPTEDHA